MTIYNLGSINADLVYRVPHLPLPGETLAARGFTRGLGGKGANMSVAAARAGARCAHIGAIGNDGAWALERLTEYGVDTRQVATSEEATGHAIIAVDDSGENSIILHPGANGALTQVGLINALAEAQAGDIFITQNETNLQADGARIAQSKGLRVAYAAAPFEAEAVRAILAFLDLLVLNEVEAAQLEEAIGKPVSELAVKDIVVTLGSKGCRWHDTETKSVEDFPAFKVDPVDTTGAGDTFTGYLIAGLDRGMPMAQAIRLASKAGALMVTRLGAADVIPDLKDVQDAAF